MDRNLLVWAIFYWVIIKCNIYYFQVYSIVIWCFYTLWNDPHSKTGYHLSPYKAVNYNLPAMQETRFWSLVQEDPLEKGMPTHPSILAWRMPWTEEPGGLQSMGLQRVGHDWVISMFITPLLHSPFVSITSSRLIYFIYGSLYLLIPSPQFWLSPQSLSLWQPLTDFLNKLECTNARVCFCFCCCC